MVLPGDELKVEIKHIGMRNGNLVVRVTTSNADGEKTLEGTAEVIVSRANLVHFVREDN